MPYRVLIEGGRTRNMYPTILSYGGGVDSTALAIRLYQRGDIPDSIVFAAVGDFRSFPEGGDIRDLARIGLEHGDEMPKTYEALMKVDDWLRDHGMPGITVITYVHLSDTYAGLYENCIANHTLPGISFGSPNCSQKHKGQGIDAWVRASYPWAFRVRRLIGYDAGPKDTTRITKVTFKIKKTRSPTEKNDWTYPLVDWQMTRDDCVALCRKTLGFVPPRSACFFCAARPLEDILDLAKRHPDRARKCIEMETAALPRLKDPTRGLSGAARVGRRRKDGTWISEPRPGRWTEIWEQAGLIPHIYGFASDRLARRSNDETRYLPQPRPPTGAHR